MAVTVLISLLLALQLVASVNAPGFNFDTTPPTIGTPTIQPATPGPSDTVTVSVTAQDPDSPVKNVSIIYSTDNWATINRTVVATYSNNTQMAVAQIPAQATGTHVQYYIIAYDPSGNRGINKNSGSYYSYAVSQSGQPITWEYVAIGVGIGALLSVVLFFTRRRRPNGSS